MKEVLLGLISRITGFRAIKFDGSHLYLLNVPMMVFSSEALSYLQYELIKKIGLENTYSVLYGLGKLHGFNGTSIYIQKFNITPSESTFPFFFEQTKLIGLGSFEVIDLKFSEKYAKIKYLKSPHARKYKERYGIQSNSVDFYQLGLCTGAFKSMVGADVEGAESKCLAWNEQYCVFEAKESSKYQKNEYPLLDAYTTNQIKSLKKCEEIYTTKSLVTQVNYSNTNTESELSTLLKQRYKQKVFEFGDEQLMILGISGLLTPMDVMALLNHILLEEFNEVSKEILYETGRKNAMIISEMMIKSLNLDKNLKTFSLLLGLTGFFGFGKATINYVRNENKDFSISISENALAKEYMKYFGRGIITIDYFLAGFISGIIKTILNNDVKIKEEICISQKSNSSNFCLFISE
jgi:predicted hydrocarbon binding protein